MNRRRAIAFSCASAAALLLCGCGGVVFLEDGSSFTLFPCPPYAEPQATQAAELWEHLAYACAEVAGGVRDLFWHVCVQVKSGPVWARFHVN